MAKKKSGGARQGAGRKTNESLGKPKAKAYTVSLYPSRAEGIKKYYGSLGKALRGLPIGDITK